MLRRFLLASLAIGGLVTQFAANAQIPIPNPPKSGPQMTFPQCLELARSIRVQRFKMGHDRKSIDKTWVAQVNNCRKLLPKKVKVSGFVPDMGIRLGK